MVTGTESESQNWTVIKSSIKTRVVLKLQGTSLDYFSSESSDLVIGRLAGGAPLYLQTYDGHYAVINPDQIPAIEVYDV